MSLKGKVVAVTRPEKQANELAGLISKLGGKPYLAPTIEIRLQRNKDSVTHLINRILEEQVEFLVFMSVNGVKSLIGHLKRLGVEARFINKNSETTIVAVGPKTRMELEKYGIKVNIVPQRCSSEGIVESLSRMDLRGKMVVIPCSNKFGGYLTRELEKLGAKVLEAPIYECTLPKDRSGVVALVNDILEGKIDAVTFTSPSTVLNLFKIAKEHVSTDEFRRHLNKTVVVAIGPTTKRTIERLGVEVNVVPEESTIESMIDSLAQYIENSTLS